MKRWIQTLCLALAFGLFGLGALAVEPDEVLDDPVLEARARDISQHLRCVVCQNQSIDDSAAPLAKDLRLLIRERLQAGDSDEQVVHFVVARYGDFVLLKPPVKPETAPLWLAPVILILGGGVMIGYYFRVVLKRKSTGQKDSAAKRKKTS
jgi:cytochrome c-type biogenesis protein CcmH